MNRFILFQFIMFSCIVSCSDRAAHPPASSSSAPATNTAASEAPDVHYPHEAYLSVDPVISVPAVRWAVENQRGSILESVWLRANCPEARKIALRYFLHFETSSPALFIDEIREISRDADNRIKEIEEVASEFERHRRK